MARKNISRAAQGSGTIRKKTVVRKGHTYTFWEARLTVGYDPGTGKQIQRSFSGKTQKEVREKMQAAAVEVNAGTYKEPSKMTLGEWLDTWLNEYLGGVKPMTVVNYTQHVENHIKPALGKTKLCQLDAPKIQHFYNDLQKPHGDTPGLAAKTVKCVNGVLHKALQQAVAVGYLRFNPADACKLPKVVRKEIKPLDNADISAFLKAIEGHCFEAIYILTLFTGLRRGEVCGLTWDCIDFEKGTMTINKQLQNIPGQPGAYHIFVPRLVHIVGNILRLKLLGKLLEGSSGKVLQVDAPYRFCLLRLRHDLAKLHLVAKWLFSISHYLCVLSIFSVTSNPLRSRKRSFSLSTTTIFSTRSLNSCSSKSSSQSGPLSRTSSRSCVCWMV